MIEDQFILDSIEKVGKQKGISLNTIGSGEFEN